MEVGRRCGCTTVVVLASLWVAACGGKIARPQGIVHVVGPGETLYRIGKAYGVSYERLSRVNKLRDPDHIIIGQRLLIPGARRRLPVSVITPKEALETRPPKVPKGKAAKWRFVWPVSDGRVSSGFGRRGNGDHDGIDIAAPRGTPVRASRDGVVVFSDRLRGYGYVIIIEHSDGYATVYGHNDSNLVKAGTRVKQGQVIARLGMSGRTSGPNLHFEVRKNNVARNPVFFLPPENWARAASGDS